MPYDDKLARLVDLLERDIARMLADQAARVAGFEDVDFDPLHGLVTYVAGGRRLWTAQVEAIGTYAADVGVFRWAWSAYERPPGRARLNVVFAEGQRLGIAALTTGQTPVPDQEQAIGIANAAAALARASGVYRTREPSRLTFYAMFDVSHGTEQRLAHSPLPPAVRSGGSRFPAPMVKSAPPPRVASGESVYPAPMTLTGALQMPKPARVPIMSMPPPPMPASDAASSGDPSVPLSRDRWFDEAPAQRAPALAVREPARDLVMPIANMALTAIVAALPQGFQQAMLVIDVTVTDGRARYSAVIVALDVPGNLVAVPTPQAVMDGIGGLIVEDARSGNGRWKRLLVRLSQKEHRVTLQIDVMA